MVSIIIPTYSRCDTLARAIDSCLQQTYKDIEIIVVDDNDPDTEYRTATQALMKSYEGNTRVTYLQHEKNKKGSAARNTGIQASIGDYITFLDDDDVLAPEKIEKQVQALMEHPEYGVVCCGVQALDEESKQQLKVSIPKGGEQAQYDMLRLRSSMGSGSNPMFTRKAIDVTGLFDTSFLRHQDTEFMIRVLRNFQMLVIEDVLITKYESGHPNRPSAKKYLAVQEHFLKTFEGDIKRYSNEQQCEIYRNNWHQMCIVAIDDRDFKVAKDCLKKAKAYKRYTLRMYLGLLKHVVNNHY